MSTSSAAVTRVSAAVLAAATVWALAGPSSGVESCERSVDATAALSTAAAEAALQAAVDDAIDGVLDSGCEDWRIELTGTFELTEALVWEVDVPLHIVGPAGSTARLEAVPAAPGGAVRHRIIDVFTVEVVTVTLERLVLTGGDVSDEGPGDDQGGAVYAEVLHLVDVELIGNHADVGGAVWTDDLHAVRTSFVGNTARRGVGTGGAVNALGDVVLENVTFQGNVARRGGAVHMEVASGTTGVGLAATFVTFLDNEATEAAGGADLHLSGASGDLPIELRGVLFGGVGTGDVSDGPTCAGTRFASSPVPALTWTSSFATDASCGGPAGSVIDRPTYVRVPFLTGATDLHVPSGGWVGLDAVDCEADGQGWPAVDQRGVTRPQGLADRCDGGAVERVHDPEEVLELTEDELTEDEPKDLGQDGVGSSEDRATPADPVGPIPTSIPAGGGGCADGCASGRVGPRAMMHAPVAPGSVSGGPAGG